jgi:hypothetical protein
MQLSSRWIAAIMLPLGLLLVLSGCDLSSANSTALLSANSAVPPTVQHRFEYTRAEVAEDGTLRVASTVEGRTLDAILADNGFSRSDVVSARVDSVAVVPITAPPAEGRLFLGSDAGGPRIARATFPDGSTEPVVDRSTTPVTAAVRDGASLVFGRFRVDVPADVPEGGGVVRAVVYYRLEVEGV